MPGRLANKTKKQLIEYIKELEAGSAADVVVVREKLGVLGGIIEEIIHTRWGQSLGFRRWRRWKRTLPSALAELRESIGQSAGNA